MKGGEEFTKDMTMKRYTNYFFYYFLPEVVIYIYMYVCMYV